MNSSSKNGWSPSERIVRQWARHVEKVRRHVKQAAGDEPALRLVLKAEDVSRFLTVSDGDGFVAAGLRIRLLGMDAPEIDQPCMNAEGRKWPCGKRARWRLFELLSGKELELLVHDVDCYGRLLCRCRANGVDVAEVMVREGLAVCYGADMYAAAQQEALQHKRGIWNGAFEEPESWRRARRLADNGASGADGAKAAAHGRTTRQRPGMQPRPTRQRLAEVERPTPEPATAPEASTDMLRKKLRALVARLKGMGKATRPSS